MPAQTVRNFTFVLVAFILAYSPYENGLSAQVTSSRRPSQISDMSTNKTNWSALSVRSDPAVSNRRKHETVAPLHSVNPNAKQTAAQTTPPQAAKSILPVAFIADQVPVPPLVAPEDFHIPTAEPNFHRSSHQLPPAGTYIADKRSQATSSYAGLPVRKKVDIRSTAARPRSGKFILPQQESSKTNQQSAASTGNEDSLLNRLPVSNLHQGIAIDALSQAVTQHTVGDPYLAKRSYEGIPSKPFASTVKTWRSPNMKHRPLYFEDPNLERYGHTHPRLQPIISGAHFFSSVALLPYNSSVTPSTTCKYSIGHDRPGDCVPTIREKHPFNARAALRQAAVVAGGIVGL